MKKLLTIKFHCPVGRAGGPTKAGSTETTEVVDIQKVSKEEQPEDEKIQRVRVWLS